MDRPENLVIQEPVSVKMEYIESTPSVSDAFDSFNQTSNNSETAMHSPVLKAKKSSEEGLGLKISSRVHRKLHQTYIKTWTHEIATNGYAECIIATCNFTSADLKVMQNHYKSCKGFPVGEKIVCDMCQCSLASYEEWYNHRKVCGSSDAQRINKHALKTNKSKGLSNKCELWKKMIEAMGKAFCGKNQCNFVGINLSDLENHYQSCTGVPKFDSFCCPRCRVRYSNQEELLLHAQNCQGDGSTSADAETEKNLHFKSIRKMKETDSSEEHIIQPWPDLPQGQYMRRRPYTKQHKNSWIASFENYKYVKCIFQNCYFIAMSLEDMIYHYGYCNGDGSFAKYVCPHCNGRVTSEAILQKHIERSHNSEIEGSRSFANGGGLPETRNEVPMDISGIVKVENSEPYYSGEEDVNRRYGYEMPHSVEMDQYRSYHTEDHAPHQINDTYPQNSTSYFPPWNVPEPVYDLNTSSEQSSFELFNCPKCNESLPSKEELVSHSSSCTLTLFKRIRDIREPGSGGLGMNVHDYESGHMQNKALRMYGNQQRINSEFPAPAPNFQPVETVTNIKDSLIQVRNFEKENSGNGPQTKKRGKKMKKSEQSFEIDPDLPINIIGEEVNCGKCDFKGTRTGFQDHNLKRHMGLGWIDGENPVDFRNEKELIRLVKPAFKLLKKGTCEICKDVKRSVMGFVTHVQNCGKSEEEKNALKVPCPICKGKYLKYSLPVHIKITHWTHPVEGEEGVPKPGEEGQEDENDPSGKRKSAIRAVTKFQDVLEDDEEKLREAYIFFQREEEEKVPKLCTKLTNAWYKLKRENKTIPCVHPGCDTVSTEVLEARDHHFRCSKLPESVYLCEACDFYTVEESEIRKHVIIHKSFAKKRKEAEGVKPVSEDEEEDDDDDEDGGKEKGEENGVDKDDERNICDITREKPKKKKKKTEEITDDKNLKKKKLLLVTGTAEGEDEPDYKKLFSKRGNIENVRGLYFYSCGLNLTLEEESIDVMTAENWPQLHTELKDWCHISPEVAESYLPKLTESISVSFANHTKNDINWKKFQRFEGDIIYDVPVMFTGGSVQCLSWCKVSFKRMLEKTARQYLALVTSKNFDRFTNILERSKDSNLIQIWDCGDLENAPATEAPKFSLGLIQEGGKVWDLTWFPVDTTTEASNDRLARLGLMATASEDGAVRIWSICHPRQLVSNQGLPIYKTEPLVKLITDDDLDDSCFRVSVGQNGLVAGGYLNGILAIWNLHNISSPFCKKQGKCSIIKAHLTIQAHRTPITALTFRPDNNRFLSTGAFDQVVKVWDLDCPSVPIEQNNKEMSLDHIWARNWPMIIYNFDEITTNGNKGVVKFLKNALLEKNHACIISENLCLGLSFSDWLNALCGGTNSGEVKVRFMKNFIHDQKIQEKTQMTISSSWTVKLDEEENVPEETNVGKKNEKPDETRLKNLPKSYEEAVLKFGIIVKDNSFKDKPKPKKTPVHPEECPIMAVNKVLFNPNLRSFSHVAVGYNNGLVRIQYLKELLRNKSMKIFLDKAQKIKF